MEHGTVRSSDRVFFYTCKLIRQHESVKMLQMAAQWQPRVSPLALKLLPLREVLYRDNCAALMSHTEGKFKTKESVIKP